MKLRTLDLVTGNPNRFCTLLSAAGEIHAASANLGLQGFRGQSGEDRAALTEEEVPDSKERGGGRPGTTAGRGKQQLVQWGRSPSLMLHYEAAQSQLWLRCRTVKDTTQNKRKEKAHGVPSRGTRLSWQGSSPSGDTQDVLHSFSNELSQHVQSAVYQRSALETQCQDFYTLLVTQAPPA